MQSRDVIVSVCVPVFNGGAYLRDCLESISAQTFADFEVLVVDDRSSDNTIDIVREYARMDQRVHLVQNEQNLGLVANWNRCIELSNGEWIKFVFQDDLLEPPCIERMLNAAGKNHLLIACRRDFIFEDGTSEGLQAGLLRQQKLLDSIYAEKPWIAPKEYAEAVLNYFGRNLLGEPTAVLLNRAIFSRFGLFNADLVQRSDLEYWNRVGIHMGVYFVRETLARFRVHIRSVSMENLVNREFRIFMDMLVLRHLAARNMAYAPLREAAARRDPPFDFEARLRDTSIAALERAKRSQINVCGAENPLRLLRELSQRYPGVLPSAGEHMTWHLRRGLRRAKKALMRRLPTRWATALRRIKERI